MEQKKHIPAIRFKGFKGEWEEKQLGYISSIERGGDLQKSDFVESGFPCIHYGQIHTCFGSLTYSVLSYISEQKFLRSKYATTHDIIMAITSEDVNDICKCVGWLGNYNVAVGGHIALIHHEQDTRYLSYFFTTKFFYNQKAKLAHGIKVMEVTPTKLQDVLINIPSLSEQQRIGSFFEHLDTIIYGQQAKLEKLKNIKTSLLNKMFPAKGEKKPAIRFKGFKDEWEEKKLGEIGDINTGNTPSTNVFDYYSDDGMLWVTPTDIKDNLIHITAKKLSIKGQKVARVVPANTILVTCIASIGKNAMICEKGCFNQQINGLTPKKSYDNYFLLTESFIWSNKMKKNAAAGTMQIVNKQEFSEINSYIPSLPEQQRIGSFFEKLDKLISLQEQKIVKLQNIKKAFLAKMFA